MSLVDMAHQSSLMRLEGSVENIREYTGETGQAEASSMELRASTFPDNHPCCSMMDKDCCMNDANHLIHLPALEDMVMEDWEEILQQADVHQPRSISHASEGISEDSEEIAGSRRNRSRHWPRRSTEYPQLTSFSLYRKHAPEVMIGRGMEAGRNLMAIFLDRGDTPRTCYRLRVERGRPFKQWPNAPSSNIVLPVGLTLAQICQYYSSHVWGTGLRLFMAEGWTGEEIWHALPEEARNDKAQHRKWNYLQQAMGREADRMYEEDNHPKRVPLKRKRIDLVESGMEVDAASSPYLQGTSVRFESESTAALPSIE